MSKQVKDLITREFQARLKDIDGVAVINPRGINAIKNNLIRRRLHEKGLRMMVVKNTLARRATEGTALKGFDKLLDGPSAVIYGKQSLPTIARAILDEKKADDTLELRGNGGGQKQATVEVTLKVRDEHEPGDYLCVAIQAYDSQGNMVMIKDPKPTKIFRIVDLRNNNDQKVEFLGWGD